MAAQTPRAPPIPVAATLSPILWQLNNPDRFDMYSAGVMLLQAAMPALRSDSALIAFRRKLEQCNYDLRAWRAQQVGSPLLALVHELLTSALACPPGGLLFQALAHKVSRAFSMFWSWSRSLETIETLWQHQSRGRYTPNNLGASRMFPCLLY